MFTRDLLSGATDADDGETATLSVANVTYTVDGGSASSTAPAGVSLSGTTLTVDPTNAAFDHLAAGATQAITVSYNVKDAQGATVAQTETITITGTNDAPVVANAIADQSSPAAAAWSYQVPADAFSDVDDNTTLSYTATLGDDSTLPAWLSFDATSRTFSGTPPQNFSGSLDLKVTASDGSLSVSDTFALAVTVASSITGQATGSVTEDVASALQDLGHAGAERRHAVLVDHGRHHLGADPGLPLPGRRAEDHQGRLYVLRRHVRRRHRAAVGSANPPATGLNSTAYTAQGGFTEAAGRAFFDGTQATTFGTTNYGDRVMLNTDISPITDPVNGTKGLKSNSDFTAEARFDLVLRRTVAMPMACG